MCNWLNKFHGFYLLSIALYDTFYRLNGFAWPYEHSTSCTLAKEDYGDVVLTIEGLPKRQSVSVLKVSGQLCSDGFKRRLVFGFTVANNLGLKQLSTIVKKLHY